ncbi:MAG: Peptidase M16 [Candidatus Nitrospira kreftii]|uniref:Peptidase M16 n=1 Tax=Candidatus Nitrospira kreftii TaxID=2652173 RepID=A0A7S8FB54_9BACT|nr:MAG: Peptidase M16 [Candidatus Nitrospira kreftii]
MINSTSHVPWYTCLVGALVFSSLSTFSFGAEPSEYILSNGMKVLLVEVPKAPVATVQVWYKVGSRNEVMGRAGLSHMLEHMMFKGTTKYPKGSFSRIVRKNGGIDNAFTGQDFTAYFENVAADRVPLALELEADRMQGLTLDNTEFQTEREVVKEERRLRSEDDPQGALVEALFAQAYMSHPYHWPVIGWFADLDAMTLEDLQRHYDTFYSPNNATLVVVGDIKADALLPTIKRLFEPIPRGPSPKQSLPVEPEQRGERRFLLKREAQVPFVMMGFRVPNYSSDDSYALDVLESILSRGKSSRLYQSLVYEQKNSLSVGAEYSLIQTDPGLFYFYSLVNPSAKVETVEAALQREIARLQNEPPSELELQRAKNQIEAARTFEQDSNFRRAMLLGQAEMVGAGWRRVDQFVERIRAVTAKDIQRVARQYLTEDNRTLGILVPLPPKPSEDSSPTTIREGRS